VIKDEPKWDSIERDAQPLLRKCLAKDPKQRLRDIGDAALLLRENANAPASGRATSRLAWAIAALALLGSVGLWITYRIAPRESPGMMKASLLYPDVAVPTNYAVPAISPDGKRVAFVASSGGGGALGQLFVRDLDSLTARPLAGTNGATYPFWSPDGKFIGFFADRKLKRIDVQGAPPITLADAAFPLGGSWSNHDVILYRTESTGLRRVPAKGGESAAVTPRRFERRNESRRGWAAVVSPGRPAFSVHLHDRRQGESHGLRSRSRCLRSHTKPAQGG